MLEDLSLTWTMISAFPCQHSPDQQQPVQLHEDSSSTFTSSRPQAQPLAETVPVLHEVQGELQGEPEIFVT